MGFFLDQLLSRDTLTAILGRLVKLSYQYKYILSF